MRILSVYMHTYPTVKRGLRRNGEREKSFLLLYSSTARMTESASYMRDNEVEKE